MLIGDAAHTAHFSIGSGTKLAMEDAIALVRHVTATSDLERALSAYHEERSVEVLKLQSAARNRMEWFENVARYADLPPRQFAYSLLTGSQRIGHDNLKVRDRGFVEDYERWLAEQAGAARESPRADVPAASSPRAHACEPRRRLADGAVHGEGRVARRTGTWCTTGAARSAARASSTPR